MSLLGVADFRNLVSVERRLSERSAVPAWTISATKNLSQGQCLRSYPSDMDSGISQALRIAARSLQVDVVTAQVVPTLRAAGVRCLLLKGPAVARWLYDPPTTRPYNDCDLLIDPRKFDQASVEMASQGYKEQLEEPRPDGVPMHTQNWAANQVVVELHRYVVGVRADPQVVFEEFFGTSHEIDVRDLHVPVLGFPARALHLALHAAQHGRGFRKALGDLERGIAQLPIDLWKQAAELAFRLDATEALVAGLCLVEGSSELVTRLGLPRHLSREVALRASTADTFSLGLEWLSQAEGLRAKGLYLLRAVFPARAFLQAEGGEPDAHGLRLGFLYILRWVSLVRRAPRGLATWLRAWKVSRRT